MSSLVRQAVRFGSVGLVNTAVGLSLIWLAMWFGAGPLLANALGYVAGLVVSFNLNRFWTFAGPDKFDTLGDTLAKARRFGGAFAVAWCLNAAVVWTGVQITDISPYLLQIAGMVTYTICFFVLCRIWVFAPGSEPQP